MIISQWLRSRIFSRWERPLVEIKRNNLLHCRGSDAWTFIAVQLSLDLDGLVCCWIVLRLADASSHPPSTANADCILQCHNSRKPQAHQSAGLTDGPPITLPEYASIDWRNSPHHPNISFWQRVTRTEPILTQLRPFKVAAAWKAPHSCIENPPLWSSSFPLYLFVFHNRFSPPTYMMHV